MGGCGVKPVDFFGFRYVLFFNKNFGSNRYKCVLIGFPIDFSYCRAQIRHDVRLLDLTRSSVLVAIALAMPK